MLAASSRNQERRPGALSEEMSFNAHRFKIWADLSKGGSLEKSREGLYGPASKV